MNCFLKHAFSILSAALLLVTVNAPASECENINTFEDHILWAGCNYQTPFDPGLIKDEEAKKNVINKGLQCLESTAKNGNQITQRILSCYYYYDAKDFKKGLYWAIQCAEHGAGEGMLVLYYAYANGEGVLKNYEESCKWLFLAAATGNELGVSTLEKCKKEINGFESMDWVMQGQKKAQEWVKEHPKAFFNPD